MPNLECMGLEYIEYIMLQLCQLVVKLFVKVCVTWAYVGRVVA